MGLVPLDVEGAASRLVRSGVAGGCVEGWDEKIGVLTTFIGFGGEGVPDRRGILHMGFSIVGGELL